SEPVTLIVNAAPEPGTIGALGVDPPQTRGQFIAPTLTAQHDELASNGGTRFGTYLANVPLMNKFTLTAPDSVVKAFYRVGAGGPWEPLAGGLGSWTFTLDMGSLPVGNDVLSVAGYDMNNIVVTNINATLVVIDHVLFN